MARLKRCTRAPRWRWCGGLALALGLVPELASRWRSGRYTSGSPGGPQPGQASGGRLPTEAELAAETAHRKQIEDLRNHIFLDEQEIKAAHGQINQLEQTIKKQQQEFRSGEIGSIQMPRTIISPSDCPKGKRKKPWAALRGKRRQAEQAAESTPSAYGRYVMQYKGKIVAGWIACNPKNTRML